MAKKFKSSERVGDSDRENDGPSSPPQPSQLNSTQPKSTQATTKKRKAVTPPAKPSKRAKSTPLPVKPAKAATPSVGSSSSDAAESDSQSQVEAGTKPSRNGKNTDLRNTHASGSSDSEEADDETGSSEASNKANGRANSVHSDSDSNSAESGSDASASDAESQGSTERHNSIAKRALPPKKITTHPSSSQAPTEDVYIPPAGFSRISSTKPETPLPDLKGKQLFHITCPASVPLSKIKKLTKNQIHKSEPISHKGARYIFRAQPTTASETTLLVPSSGGKYKPSSKRFDKRLALQEIVDADQAGNTSRDAITKPVVQQPEGLKPRNFPAGFDPRPTPRPAVVKQFKKPQSINSQQSKALRQLESSASDGSADGVSSDSSASGASSAASKQRKRRKRSSSSSQEKSNRKIKTPRKRESTSSSSDSPSDISSTSDSDARPPPKKQHPKKPSNPNGTAATSKRDEDYFSNSESASVTSDNSSRSPIANGTSTARKRNASASSASSASGSEISDSSDNKGRKRKAPVSGTGKAKPPESSSSESSSEEDSDSSMELGAPRKTGLTIGEMIPKRR